MVLICQFQETYTPLPTMDWRPSVFGLLLLQTVLLTALTSARQYITDDAVIIEVDEPRQKRSSGNETARELWPGVIPTGPCFASNGQLGKCVTFRQCYPYFKLPELTSWETWVLGMYDTCSYFTVSGRQMFGVCCTNIIGGGRPDGVKPPQSGIVPPTTERLEEVDHGGNNGGGSIPANWPPPIPTHPPDHTIPPLPTHPPSPGYPGIVQPTAPVTSTRPPPPPTTHRPPPPTTPRPPQPPQWPPAVAVDATCGAKNGYQDQERIVGGQDADPNEWPWIAALFNSGRQFCGGSLIDNIHILTAAHCVAHMSAWDVARLSVRLGDHNINTNSETRHIEKKVKRVVRHRGFDSRTLYNDIAILTLDSPVSYTKTVKSICLPSGGAQYSGKTATVIGWGSLSEGGRQPSVLQEVNIPVWTNAECRAKYGPAAPGGIVDHFLCAGQAARDSCSGDSGGPLMVNEGRWTQVGIVSWGIGCGKGQYPGVYTRVTHFLPWISKNIKQ